MNSLKKRGAACWVGDNPGLSGYAANERCAHITGLKEAANGCFIYLGKDAVPVEAKSPWPEKAVVSKALFDADFVINVPKFKTHMQTKMTGAVKNLFGLLIGALHQGNVARRIALGQLLAQPAQPMHLEPSQMGRPRKFLGTGSALNG